MKHIKIIGIGADGFSLASHVLAGTPHARLLLLSDKESVLASPEYKDEEVLMQSLTDTCLLLISTNITDAVNLINVERVVHAAREQGVLVLGVALPCTPETTQKMLHTWFTHVDALFVGEPEKLHINLRNAVNEVAEIINESGHVNVDFEDIRHMLSMRGVVRIGTSTAAGNNRAQRAALSAIQDINLNQAQGLFVLISAAKGCIKLAESRQVMHTVNNFLPNSAHVIFSAAYDDSLGDKLRVTFLVSGLPSPEKF